MDSFFCANGSQLGGDISPQSCGQCLKTLPIVTSAVGSEAPCVWWAEAVALLNVCSRQTAPQQRTTRCQISMKPSQRPCSTQQHASQWRLYSWYFKQLFLKLEDKRSDVEPKYMNSASSSLSSWFHQYPRHTLIPVFF